MSRNDNIYEKRICVNEKNKNLKCHLFVTLILYYNFSKRKFEKKGKYNGNFKS